MSSDVSDPEPLTSAHLLYGHRIVPLSYPTTDGSEIDNPTYGETTAAASLETRVVPQHAQVLATTLPTPLETERMNSVSRLETLSLCMMISLERSGRWQ